MSASEQKAVEPKPAKASGWPRVVENLTDWAGIILLCAIVAQCSAHAFFHP